MGRKKEGWQKKPKDPKGTKRHSMLNVKDEVYFKYHLKNILESSKMEDKVKNPFIATLVSKASRMSIRDAKDYLEEKCGEGIVEEELKADILRLLDRYTKYR